MIFPVGKKIIFALLKAAPHVKDWWETYCELKDESTGSLFSTAPTWDSFQDAIKEQYYPIGSYEDQNIKWTTLSQGRDQDMPEFTNIFHTLCIKLGIKDSEQHLAKLQAKNIAVKLKKDTGKWCEFHKSSIHNTSECQAKQSLVAKLKVSELDACADSESKLDKGNDKGKQMIDAEPNAIVATMKIQKEEPKDPEGEEHLLHSQMWVKGSLLQFIVDSGSQKNLILAEVVKRLGLVTTAYPQPYTIRWLHQGWDLCVSQRCHLPYNIKPFTDDVLCEIAHFEVCDVLLGQPYLWKQHAVYKSRPRAVIVTLGSKLYMILEIALPTTISLVIEKQCSKLISKTEKFVFLMIRPQGKKKTMATTSRQGPSACQLQMDKVVEEYKDIFTSLAGVRLHCQVKHSIDLTPGALLPNGPICQCFVLENNEIKRQI
eukprot:PITA_23244